MRWAGIGLPLAAIAALCLATRAEAPVSARAPRSVLPILEGPHVLSADAAVEQLTRSATLLAIEPVADANTLRARAELANAMGWSAPPARVAVVPEAPRGVLVIAAVGIAAVGLVRRRGVQ